MGLIAIGLASVTAQTKLVRIEDWDNNGQADPALRASRYLGINDEGNLQWLEKTSVNMMNYIWYQIPVEGSADDEFFLQNVATGDFIYRGNERNVVFPQDWGWETAELSKDNEETDFYKFRAMQTINPEGNERWGGRVWLVNVAGADFSPPDGTVYPLNKNSFILSGMLKNATVYGTYRYPDVCFGTTNDGGNNYTSVSITVLAENAELVKRRVRIENAGDGIPTAYLGENADGELEWTTVTSDNSAWYEIPVEGTTTDFYYKNQGTGKYIYRSTEKGINLPTGDWQWEKALLSVTNEETDFYKFRLYQAQDWWDGRRSWMTNLGGVTEENPTAVSGAAFILSGINGVEGFDNYPAYPAVIMHTMPGNTGNWRTSVLVERAQDIQYFIVTFDQKNGTVTTQRIAEDDKVAKPADPTRINHIFLGWSLNEQGEDDGAAELEEFDFDTPVTGDFTLYAWWEYQPEELVERAERKVRILNWGNNDGIDSKFITYAYLGENGDGKLEWIDATNPDNVNDYTAWIEVPVEGSNYLNYYKNAATGKYIYMGIRLNDDGEPLYTSIPSQSWRWEPALLSETIDEDNITYYQFWPIAKYGDGGREWGNRCHLANMGGVTAENPFAVDGGAFYLGPINSNHGGDAFLNYPEVVMSTVGANNGNVWASVLIEPIITQVRIIDYGNGEKPPKFLALRENEKYNKDDVNDVEYFVEWTDEENDASLWEEMLAGGSTTEYYYRNTGTTSKNHGTGQFIYREAKGFEGDWGQAKALSQDAIIDDLNADSQTDYFQFRKEPKDDRFWLVNMADAEFDTDGKFVNKKAFVLSGINKDLDWMEYEYPTALMHIMPDKSNVWGSVTFSEVGQKRTYIITFKIGPGNDWNFSVEEGEPAECPAEDPKRDGSTFEGWFKDADFTEAYDCSDPAVVTGNMIIYAKWEEIPAPKDCTPDIKVVRIGNFQGATEGDTKFYPRGYLKCSEAGYLSWFVYPDANGDARPNPGTSGAVFGTFGSDFDPADETSLWYEIPVPGSNLDKYYKNVANGRYLCLDLSTGAKYPDTYKDEDGVEHPHPKAGQFMKPSEAYEKTEAEPFPRAAWMWRGVKTSGFNDKTAEFKWRRLDTKDWGNQGWGACFLANAYDVGSEARWSERSAYYALSEHKRLHTEATSPSDVGFPDFGTMVIATTLGGDTNLTMGNAWTAAGVWESPDKRNNPDCCQVGGDNVECCNGDPSCPRPCDGPVCECNPTSAECILHCYQMNEDGTYDANCCGKAGYHHAQCGETGVPEIRYFEDLKVFPNPTNNLLNISGLKGGELITIYDISGRRILNTFATDELTSIPVSHLTKGAYIVKVSNKFGEFSTKFVIN